MAAAAAEVATEPAKVLSFQHNADQGIDITVSRSPSGTYSVRINSTADRPELCVYWGVEDWAAPDPTSWPPGTSESGGGPVLSPLGASGEVVISFPEASCPSKVVFVLREGEKWMNNGGGDFAAYLKPPGVDEIVQKVITAETEHDRWSLFNRFVLATQLLDAALAAGPSGMGLMLTWLRLSSLRLLPWYKGTNYQSKDAAHVQKVLAQRMADAARGAEHPACRMLARACMATLPRGGGNGDDIRMGILNVMREHGIAEGHRPGIRDEFLESWHQKLHTNTTPEDVTICEAYLAFLHTNDMGEFWRVAWERGRLTPETLTSMDHPIKPHPFHLPQLIPSMQHYLWILKTTHAGADLDVAFEMTRGRLDGELAWMIGDLLAHRNEWWVPGKIVEVRRRLEGYWRADGAPRDVLMLDIALDSYFRLCVERTDKAALSRDDLITLVGLVLDNAVIASESEELSAAHALWNRLLGAPGRWEEAQWGALALAAADNVSLCLEAFADGIVAAVQPYAERFGAACAIDPTYILNFSEEVVRSQPAFILSPLLQQLGPALRAAAGVGAWQVVSQGSGVASGRLVSMPDLTDIQGKTMPEATVIVAERLTGNEDIPEGVTAIVTSSATDVLSHVAIRARAQGVLLATCFDPEQLDAVRAMVAEHVVLSVAPSGDVVASAGDAPAASNAAEKGGTAPKVKVAKPKAAKSKTKTAPWVLQEADFADGLVGGKALNLAALRGKLPAAVGMPSSIALPFGTFERVLAHTLSASVAARVADLEAEVAKVGAGGGVPPALSALRETISSQLVAPPELVAEAAAAAAASGLIVSAEEWAGGESAAWHEAWAAISAVWASKWNDRAWLSRRAQGIPDTELYMSVLLQTVIPAQYAFVLHTADPITGDKDRLHGELVAGMGEALVGNFPGRALSFACSTTGSTILNLDIAFLPSKRDALRAVGDAPLIARSDSNGEDLEAFAGAGLYDSVPLSALRRETVRYAESALLWDAAWRGEMLKSLAEVGVAIEAACGSPQDVEGVVDAKGEVFVVQTRPQVL